MFIMAVRGGFMYKVKDSISEQNARKTFGTYAVPFALVVIKSSLFDSLRNTHKFTE